MFQLDKVWGRWTLSFYKDGWCFCLKIYQSRFLFGVVKTGQKITLERVYEPYDYKFEAGIASASSKKDTWVFQYPDQYQNEFRLLLNRWDAIRAVVELKE